MYFPRYLIGSILTACFTIVIKYLGKHLTIYLILSCAKEAIYKRQNSIFSSPEQSSRRATVLPPASALAFASASINVKILR